MIFHFLLTDSVIQRLLISSQE